MRNRPSTTSEYGTPRRATTPPSAIHTPISPTRLFAPHPVAFPSSQPLLTTSCVHAHFLTSRVWPQDRAQRNNFSTAARSVLPDTLHLTKDGLDDGWLGPPFTHGWGKARARCPLRPAACFWGGRLRFCVPGACSLACACVIEYPCQSGLERSLSLLSTVRKTANVRTSVRLGHAPGWVSVLVCCHRFRPLRFGFGCAQ